MPGHIYVLCGDYEKARLTSVRAIRANDMFLDYAGPFTFYTVACCHDLHLMMHTCMFLGRYKDALDAADKICALVTKDVLSVKNRPKFVMSLEGYYSTRMHVLVRFGRWQDIVDAPMPDDPDMYLVTTAMHHYAKGVAHAALKNFREADEERALFHRKRRPHSEGAPVLQQPGARHPSRRRKNARRRARVPQGQPPGRLPRICAKAFAATTTCST